MVDIRLVKGPYDITLTASNVVENLKKTLWKLERPQTSQTASPIKYIKDRRKISHDIVIRGWIEDRADKTAFEIKDELIAMFKLGGKLDNFVWRGVSYPNFWMEKLQIEDTPLAANASTSTPGVARLRYSIGLTWGQPK